MKRLCAGHRGHDRAWIDASQVYMTEIAQHRSGLIEVPWFVACNQSCKLPDKTAK